MLLQAKVGTQEVFVDIVDLTSFVHAEPTSSVWVYSKNFDGKIGRVEKSALSEIRLIPDMPTGF